MESDGDTSGESITFQYDNPNLGKSSYGFNSRIKTVAQPPPITKKLPYPIRGNDFQEFTEATQTIDSENNVIKNHAQQLVAGKDDLFEVVFALARWTEENIEYDLSTLTADASLQASWVLENKVGVCDELTSLFIAMTRSLGIPARFVKGISHTNSEAFDTNWVAHGWAEVYFPDVGWVPFDPTYGQYGYVDAAHFKLRESDDPKKADVLYRMEGSGVQLKPGEILPEINIINRGKQLPKQVDITVTHSKSDVAFGSSNEIHVNIKNLENRYIPVTLQLAVPGEVTPQGRNKQTFLLKPSEEKEISWEVQVSSSLDDGYRYSLPYRVFSERNISSGGEFTGVASVSVSAEGSESSDDVTIPDVQESVQDSPQRYRPSGGKTLWIVLAILLGLGVIVGLVFWKTMK